MAYGTKTSLQRKNNGIKFENAIAFFEELQNNKISVGVHKDKGALVVKKAVHTEFGTTIFKEGWETPFGKVHVVPPRPVVRMYLYKEMKDAISETYEKKVNSEIKSKLKNPKENANNVQSEIGEVCVILQQGKITKGGFDNSTNDTGLDPEHNGMILPDGTPTKTIGYKGFDHPWYQTGETMEAIDYKVEKR